MKSFTIIYKAVHVSVPDEQYSVLLTTEHFHFIVSICQQGERPDTNLSS